MLLAEIGGSMSNGDHKGGRGFLRNIVKEIPIVILSPTIVIY